MQDRIVRLSDIVPPAIRFSKFSERVISPSQEPAKIAIQKRRLGEPAQRAERGLVLNDIANQGAAQGRLEVMVVRESVKDAFDHDIAEVGGSIVFGDPAPEGLPNPEMTRLPGDLVTELQKVMSHAANHAFHGMRRGVEMRADAAKEIETPLDWSEDLSSDFYAGHSGWAA